MSTVLCDSSSLVIVADDRPFRGRDRQWPRSRRRQHDDGSPCVSEGGRSGTARLPQPGALSMEPQAADANADYTIRIATGLVDLAPGHIVSTTLYNGSVSGSAPALQGGAAGRGRRVQRHRHAGARALARSNGAERGRWRGGRRHAVRARARHAPHRVRSATVGVPLLPHARDGGRRPQSRHLHGPGRPRLHRAEGQCRRLRPRSLSRAEGVRAVMEPRRRHGDGHAGGRAAQGIAGDGEGGRRGTQKAHRRASRPATSCSASTAGCAGTASRSA